MRFAFLIDPPESLKIAKDTSFALMLEAQARGHKLLILERGDISAHRGQLHFRARAAQVKDDKSSPFTLGPYQTVAANAIDALFIRTDPPFDTAYLTDTWLLSMAAKKPLVLNSPAGLRTINEKIWAAAFADITPETLITADGAEFADFLSRHGSVVLKPTDGFGGSAIFLIRAGDKNAAVTFETLQRMSGYVVVQAYLSAATEGDKRILLLQGEILGAVLRYHGDSDHRNNFAAGGQPRKAELSAADLAICERLKPHLQAAGIFFAGIDVIGDKLIEVNVTSPTCLREMQQYYTENLAQKVIIAAEEEIRKHAGN